MAFVCVRLCCWPKVIFSSISHLFEIIKLNEFNSFVLASVFASTSKIAETWYSIRCRFFFLLNSKFICAENESHEVIKISLGDILNRADLHLF